MKAIYSGRQVIRTKYLGPTNTKPGRIRASCEAGSVIVSWDHALNVGDNHAAACKYLADKLGWEEDRVGSSYGHMFYWIVK